MKDRGLKLLYPSSINKQNASSFSNIRGKRFLEPFKSSLYHDKRSCYCQQEYNLLVILSFNLTTKLEWFWHIPISVCTITKWSIELSTLLLLTTSQIPHYYKVVWTTCETHSIIPLSLPHPYSHPLPYPFLSPSWWSNLTKACFLHTLLSQIQCPKVTNNQQKEQILTKHCRILY